MSVAIFSPSECYLFSPPHPIKKFFYRCDRKFHLDDLIKLYEIHDDYAIVLISGKRTEFYLHNINQTKFLKAIDESLPNQHKTGGQSAQRFGRVRDEKITWYAKKIAENMVHYYVKNGQFGCKGLIIAGPAEMKDLVSEQDLFTQFFKKYLLKTLTISEITDQSIYSVVQLSADVMTSDLEEKKLIDSFEEMIVNPDLLDKLIFGTKEVMTKFTSGHLEEIFVSNKYENKDLILKSNTKTKIHIIKSSSFTAKYDELVGIKYYVTNDDYESDNII